MNPTEANVEHRPFDIDTIAPEQQNVNQYESSNISQEQQAQVNNTLLQNNTTHSRYQSLMSAKHSTKNLPKTIGNNIKKFIAKHKKTEQNLFPQDIKDFCNKKQPGQQSKYTLNDFHKISKKQIQRKIVLQYLKKYLFLDLIQSNKIVDPTHYIQFIEQYLRGCNQPEKFIGNRILEPIRLCQNQNTGLELMEGNSFILDNQLPLMNSHQQSVDNCQDTPDIFQINL